MKNLICILLFNFVSHAQPIYDATEGVLDLNQVILDLPNREGLSLGNGCGGLGGGDYATIETPSGLELDGLSKLQIMWLHLTVNGPITDFGEPVDVLDLIFDGRIELFCSVSEEYDNESTIVVLDETLGNEEETLDQIVMFPNPASNQVTIKGNNINRITCFDMNGRQVFQVKKPIYENRIYLFNYKAGVYLIRIEGSDSKVDTKKLIIK